MSGNINDRKIIAALISSPTIEDAAKVAKVNPRTIYRKLKEPEFKSALDTAQNQVLSSTVRHMTFLFSKATKKLEQLMEAKSERVQLQALRLLLQSTPALRRDVEFDVRLQTLENEKVKRNIFSEDSDD